MKLKVFLAINDMTLTEFAKKVDTGVQYLSSISCGRATPSKRLVKDIVQATNGQVTAEDLMNKLVCSHCERLITDCNNQTMQQLEAKTG
jgi:DNA-binding transcriptional regulator YdaS (Cro superfamily)